MILVSKVNQMLLCAAIPSHRLGAYGRKKLEQKSNVERCALQIHALRFLVHQSHVKAARENASKLLILLNIFRREHLN
jgi:hypothetical protein